MKNKLFNEDGSIFIVTNIHSLLDTFTIEELESLFVLNKYYHELNKDLLELVKLGYVIDVNNVGYNEKEHDASINEIIKYVKNNFDGKLINQWECKIDYDWRKNKPKNLK